MEGKNGLWKKRRGYWGGFIVCQNHGNAQDPQLHRWNCLSVLLWYTEARDSSRTCTYTWDWNYQMSWWTSFFIIIFYYYCASFMKCIDPVCFQKCLYLDCPFAIKQRPWDAGSWITSLAPGALAIWREWWLDNSDRHLWRIVEGKWTVKLKVYAWKSHTVMDQLPAWGCICTCMT